MGWGEGEVGKRRRAKTPARPRVIDVTVAVTFAALVLQ